MIIFAFVDRDTTTVLPRLVRMHTIKLMSCSGFILTERSYYPRGRTIQLITSLPISQIYFFYICDKKKPLKWSIFLISWHFWTGTLWFGIAVTLKDYLYLLKKTVIGGVLIERAVIPPAYGIVHTKSKNAGKLCQLLFTPFYYALRPLWKACSQKGEQPIIAPWVFQQTISDSRNITTKAIGIMTNEK